MTVSIQGHHPRSVTGAETGAAERDTSPSVTILLAVHNGQPYLQEQLNSIARQTHGRWRILASDDGSCDTSRDILDRFAAATGRLRQISGPRLGPAANFLFLIRAFANLARENDVLAFCDQDDVWMPERLAHGMRALDRLDTEKPALFCSRTLITGAELQSPRPSRKLARPPGFRNALVQNIAAGNTILLNRAGTRLICDAAGETDAVVMHDWWVYQVITAAGGVVIHENTPLIYYRQHRNNQIGANTSFTARCFRVWMIASGQIRKWNDINVAALRQSAHRFEPQNQAFLEAFARMRGSVLPARLWRLWQLGVYRQSFASGCALWMAAMFGRL